MHRIDTLSPNMRPMFDEMIAILEESGIPMVRERLAMLPSGDIVCTKSMEKILRTRPNPFIFQN